MSFFFKASRARSTPAELVKVIRDSIVALDTKTAAKALEDVEKNIISMRQMLSGDGEAEPSQEQISLIALEICKEDVLSLFVQKLPSLGWDARKDLVHCWGILLRQKVDSIYCCVEYIENHLDLLDFLVVCFYPSSQPTHKVRDIIRSRFDAPYISWKKIPLNVRDIWFREFEKDFKWLPQHHDRVRKNFEKRGSTRLRDMFTDIRKKGERPLWIGEDVWADLCASWGTPEYIQKRAQNKGNRASDSAGMGTSLHTGGSIPHAEHRRRLEKSLGRQPTVVEVHTRTHQRQETQEWITPKAQKAYEDYMQLSQIQSSGGEGSSSTASCRRSDYELWTEAVGGIQKGRIYGLGSEAGSYRSHSYTPTDVDMEERLRTRLRDEIRAEVRADVAAEVDARFAQINENIRAGFERMSREMHDRREPPTEQPDEDTESDRDA